MTNTADDFSKKCMPDFGFDITFLPCKLHKTSPIDWVIVHCGEQLQNTCLVND